MRTIFFLIFFFTLPLIHAQTEDEWVYQISFEDRQGEDPDTWQTAVFVTVNLSLVPDSTLMVLKIGSVYGESDIYRRELLQCPELAAQTGVEFIDDGSAIRVDLGQYTIEPENFYVDMELQYRE